jgi:acyl-CoA synthetase (NDP forming)
MHDQLLEAAEVLIRLSKTLTKPLAVVFYAGGRLETIAAVMEAQQKCLEGGLAVYSTVEAAAKAINRFLQYHEFIERERS